MRKIRVLHCLQRIDSGGVEQRRLSLVRGLDSSIYDQKIVCTSAVGGLPELIRSAGCEIIEVGEFEKVFDFKRVSAALDVVRSFKLDIIHGAVFEGVALAVTAGFLGRVPVIIGEETSDPQNRSWKGSLLYRFYSGFTHHMVAVSPATEEYLCSKIRLPRKKVTTIWSASRQSPLD